MIDFSKYHQGKLVNIQNRVGRFMIETLVDALMADGRADVFDPHHAMHSRMKCPLWEIHFEVSHRLIQSLLSKDAPREKVMDIYAWLRENVIAEYDLSDDVPEGHFIFSHPTMAELQARIPKELIK